MKTDKRALRQLALDEIAKEKTSAKISEKAEAGPAPVEKWLDIPSLPPPAYIRNAGVSPTSTSSSGSSIKEKPLALEGPHEPLVPNKTQGHLLRNIRHQIFSLYRRLFGIVFVVNMVIFIITCVRGASVVKLGEIVVANLLCAVLMRQDYVINAFFTVCCSVPTS